MRLRWPMALVSACLCACAGLASQPEVGQQPMHRDLAYDQFVLSADGKSPYDLTSFQGLPAECGATAAPPKAGGVSVTSILSSVVDKLATAIVNELKKWVNAQIAEYSNETSGKPARVGFYDDKLWFTHPGEAAKYSCFIVALNRCVTSQMDESRKVCKPESADNRVVIVGQYRRTSEYLQVRPLFGRVKGFEARRNPSEKEASIAATLKFDSVWWDGHQGHTEPSMTAKVLALKFKPTSGEPGDPGIDLPVEEKDPHGHYALADWGVEPLLPRPPQSPGSSGTTSIIPTVAETNAPPRGLTLIEKALGDNSSQISSALKSALETLIPKK